LGEEGREGGREGRKEGGRVWRHVGSWLRCWWGQRGIDRGGSWGWREMREEGREGRRKGRIENAKYGEN